jgi:hypothetical protein
MKVEVRINCGNVEKTVFISCGRGDKSFKWLGMVASQRFALAAPNGALRRRDSDNPRGINSHCQQLPQKITLDDGETPHPASQIVDYLKDGDVVRCVLGNQLPVTSIGSPNPTTWTTAAFTAAGAEIESVVDENNEEVDDGVGFEQQSHAAFMKVILESQMFDHKRIEQILVDAWSIVPRTMPRITPSISESLCNVVLEHSIMLLEVFHCYAPEGRMDFASFKEFVDDAEFFSARDVSRQVSRVYRRAIKGADSDMIDMGGFLATLVLVAQVRHNDTLDDQTTFVGSADALSHLLKIKIPSLAERLNLDCLFRMEFCDVETLCEMRHYHNDVFLVFDHYAAKMQRDLPLTLTMEFATEIFYQSGLVDTPEDVAIVKKIADKANAGILIGRAPVSGVEAPPRGELTFAEFMEVCARIGVKEYLGKPYEEDGEDPNEVMNKADAMLRGMQDVGECLTHPKPRKLPSPRPDERDRRGRGPR